MIILALKKNKNKNTVFQISIEIPIVKLASKLSCQEVCYFKQSMKNARFKNKSYAGEERD